MTNLFGKLFGYKCVFCNKKLPKNFKYVTDDIDIFCSEQCESYNDEATEIFLRYDLSNTEHPFNEFDSRRITTLQENAEIQRKKVLEVDKN